MTTTEEPAAPPKRVAMQVAIAAEQQANANAEAIGNLAHSVAELTKQFKNSPPLGIAHDTELVKRVDSLTEELANVSALAEAAAESGGAAPAGSVLAELRDEVVKLIGLVPGNLWADKGGALATQQQVAEVRDLVGELDDWRAQLGGHLPSGQADQILYQLERRTGDALSELREQIGELRSGYARLAVSGDHASATPVPAILGQMLELQRMVASIGKDRTATIEGKGKASGHSYDFRGIDDAMDAIGYACREIGIIGPRSEIIDTQWVTDRVPRFYNGKQEGETVWTTCRLKMRYIFVSPIDGSEFPVEGVGTGRDNGDKDGSKASSAAMKYALFQGLCIPVRGVNIDPESEHPQVDYPADTGRTYGGNSAPEGWRPDASAQRVHAGGYVDGQPQAEWQAEQQQAQAEQPPAAPVDNRPPEVLARDALKAVRSAATLADAVKVWSYVNALGYLSFHVEGAPLGVHLLAAIRILPGGHALAPSALPGSEHFQ